MPPTIDQPADKLAELRSQPSGSRALLTFSLEQYWLPDSPVIELGAICLNSGPDLLCVISDDVDALNGALSDIAEVTAGTLDSIAQAIDSDVINLSRPLMLDTIRIAKPWGAEIWYTGVEQRGVCRVGKTPLPWIIRLAGSLCCGDASERLILLKILDPLPEQVYGDLYFEMHEQKVEVYVVTNVAPSAWPEGTGAIRFGFDNDKRGESGSLDAFKREWLSAVNAYRETRMEIDATFDQFREEEQFDATDVVSPDVLERWSRQLDPQLVRRERDQREAMHAFTKLEPLMPGDVVRVPPFTPHSLQHGVRVVEFQTPHYERYILSFAQKVLTQAHWDTEQAIDKIVWDAEFDSTLVELESGERHRIDLVADFDEFEVQRIYLQPGASHRIATPDYAIVMAIDGSVIAGDVELAAEQACLLPAILPAIEIRPAGNTRCFALLAMPKTPGS